MIVQNYMEHGKSMCRIPNCGDGWRGYNLILSNRDAVIEGAVSSENSSITLRSSVRDIRVCFERVKISDNPLKVENLSKNLLLLQDSFGDNVILIPPNQQIFLMPQVADNMLFSSKIKVEAYMPKKSYTMKCYDAIKYIVDSLNFCKYCCKAEIGSSDYMSLASENQGINEMLLGNDGQSS
jgi:hypothetical protein